MKPDCNDLFYLGKRAEDNKHAQLRMQCSKRSTHLFALHVIESPSCVCGHNFEDSDHYLKHCALFMVPRHHLLQTLHDINMDELNVDILLSGSDIFDTKSNISIFEATQQFIYDINRLQLNQIYYFIILLLIVSQYHVVNLRDIHTFQIIL